MNRDKSNYNNMIYKKLSLSVLLFAAGFLTTSAQKSPQDMDRFIDVLMNKMTLEEKIGQLNLPVTGEITSQEQRHRRQNQERRSGRIVQSERSRENT